MLLVAPWFKVPYPCKYSGGQRERGQELMRAPLRENALQLEKPSLS